MSKLRLCYRTQFQKRVIPQEAENAVIPIVWAGEVSGISKRAESVRNGLKPGSSLVRDK